MSRTWRANGAATGPTPPSTPSSSSKAYTAIKRGNPNAIVINAGMAPTGDNNDIAMPDDIFYDLMYQAMGGNSTGYFDMLGVHGAGYAAPPELDPAERPPTRNTAAIASSPSAMWKTSARIMEKYGDAAKKIVLLEFGWTSDEVNPAYKWHGADAGIDDIVQADYLKRAYEYAAANWPWVGLMSLHHHAQPGLAQRRQPAGRRTILVGDHGAEPHRPALLARAAYMVSVHLLQRSSGQEMPVRPK